MANAYLLNGTVSPIRVRVNNGTDILLDPLDLQTANLKSTAKLALASSPGQGILGIGSNEVLVTIGGITTKWNVELSAPPITIALDVQLQRQRRRCQRQRGGIAGHPGANDDRIESFLDHGTLL